MSSKSGSGKVLQKKNPLFESKIPNYCIGNDIQPKRNLTKYVRWPKYIRLQRQKRILRLRLKVPPAINQFTRTLDVNTAASLFKLLNKYRPETKADKKKRLVETAKKKIDKKNLDKATKPYTIKYGINHVTALIENKKPKLVVIAHDVDPIEVIYPLNTFFSTHTSIPPNPFHINIYLHSQ